MGVDIPQREGAIVGVVRPSEKHEKFLYAAKRITQPRKHHCNAPAVADCNSSDWSVSHYIVPSEKSAPAMRPFVEIL